MISHKTRINQPGSRSEKHLPVAWSTIQAYSADLDGMYMSIMEKAWGRQAATFYLGMFNLKLKTKQNKKKRKLLKFSGLSPDWCC